VEDAGDVVVPDGGAPVGAVGINELLASNRGTIQDGAGDFGDWVELYNSGDADEDIGGWSISDDATLITRFVFPAGTTIRAGAFLLLWADGEPEETDDELHLPFRLAASGESLYLAKPGGVIVDSAEWGPQASDVSWGRLPDGDGPFATLSPPTPRAPNDGSEAIDAGIVPDAGTDADAGIDAGCTTVDVRLSEVMVDDVTSWPDQFGSHEPWIEVVNAGDVAVALADLAVTDDPLTPREAPLPGVLVQPGDVLVAWADGDVQSAPGHVALVLTHATERLYLFDRCGVLVDELPLPADVVPDVSVGPDGDGGVAAYASPTPDVADNGPFATPDAGTPDAG